MDTEKEPEVSIILIPSPDDPPIRSVEYQAELKAFSGSLTSHGIKFGARAVAMDSVHGGGYSLGEYFIAVASIKQAAQIIKTYILAKNARKVKLVWDGGQAEAPTVEEVDRLIKMIPKDKARQTDRDLLLNTLASVDAARLESGPKHLRLGVLLLTFGDDGKLVRLELNAGPGNLRQYEVRLQGQQ
jgi:hypothetical protein